MLILHERSAFCFRFFKFFYVVYLLRVIILDVTERLGSEESARESESRYQPPLVDTIRKEKRKQEYLAVVRLLLPTSNLLLPWTVVKDMNGSSQKAYLSPKFWVLGLTPTNFDPINISLHW